MYTIPTGVDCGRRRDAEPSARIVTTGWGPDDSVILAPHNDTFAVRIISLPAMPAEGLARVMRGLEHAIFGFVDCFFYIPSTLTYRPFFF